MQDFYVCGNPAVKIDFLEVKIKTQGDLMNVGLNIKQTEIINDYIQMLI